MPAAPKPARTRARSGTRPAAKSARYHHGDLRRALVEAALTLVDERGGDVITLRAAARLAGVSEAAPYAHFPDKEALLAAVAARGFDALAASMRRAARKAGPDDAIGRMRSMGAAYVRFALARPSLFRLMTGPVASRRAEHPVLAEAAEAASGLLGDALGDCQRAGWIAAGDTTDIRLAAWALVHGLASLANEGLLAVELKQAGGVEALVERVALRLFVGIAPRAIREALDGHAPQATKGVPS